MLSNNFAAVYEPLVTVIMPAYNSASYIKVSIQSVLNQTMSNFELIVINDCSSDGTASVVDEMAKNDTRVRVINLLKNMGAPAGPRNIGVREARGAWIAFLDSDDIWHSAKLEHQLDLLYRTGARFCSTSMREFTDISFLHLSDAKFDDYEWISFTRQLIKFRTPTSSVVADRLLLLENPFNEDLTYKAREDLDCWLHCHESIGKSVKIIAPMIGYRIIPGQISGNKFRMIYRHYHVLKNYHFKSGRKIGLYSILFTATHFFLSIFYRKLKNF